MSNIRSLFDARGEFQQDHAGANKSRVPRCWRDNQIDLRSHNLKILPFLNDLIPCGLQYVECFHFGPKKIKLLRMEAVLDRHIESTPGIRAGKPRIAGTRMTVADVVILYLRLDHSIEEIAGKYDLPLAAVYAALAYYYDHREEIDKSIDADEAYIEAFRRNNPSPLQAKLRALSGD